MSMLEHHEHKRPTHDFDGIIEDRIQSPPVYFTVLFYGLVVWGVAFCAYFLLSGWSSESEFKEEMAFYKQEVRDQQPAEPPAMKTPAAGKTSEKEETAASSEEGEKIYAANCAACHGADGGGGIGPDLTDETYKYGRSLEEITTSISDGRPGGMPAFGNQLSRAEISSVAGFVLNLGK